MSRFFAIVLACLVTAGCSRNSSKPSASDSAKSVHDDRIYRLPVTIPLEVIDKLPALKFPFGFEVSGWTFNDTGMKSLARFKELRLFRAIANKEITDAGLREIAGLTELRRLALGGTSVTPAVFDIVTDMKKLTCLELNFTTPGVIEKYDRIGILHAMVFVRRPASKFRPANPDEVTHADFHLTGQMITGANLKRFLQFSNITHLNIPKAHISEEGAEDPRPNEDATRTVLQPRRRDHVQGAVFGVEKGAAQMQNQHTRATVLTWRSVMRQGRTFV